MRFRVRSEWKLTPLPFFKELPRMPKTSICTTDAYSREVAVSLDDQNSTALIRG